MNVEGEITERDYLQSRWLYMKPRRAYAIVGSVILFLFGSAFVFQLIAGIIYRDLRPAAVSLIAVALLLFGGASYWWAFRRLYRSQPSLRGSHNFAFTETGFSAVSQHGTGEATWSVFTKWREDSKMFLLYTADNLFIVIPKRWFDGATSSIDEFRDVLVKQAIPSID